MNHSVRLEADDACGILQLARYSARAPVSLERLRYDERKEQVTLQSDKRERLVCEYGAYSTRRRARWRRSGVLTDTRTLASVSPAPDCAPPDWPALRAIRQRWAELLKRIYEVDPLRCRRCNGEMRIIAFILDADVIAAILRHLRCKGRDPRALPEDSSPAAGRSPPQTHLRPRRA